MKPGRLEHHIGIVLALLTLFVHFVIQRKYRLLPLLGDETYYATPQIIEDPWNWAHYSFGHPPGWLFINRLAFSLFGAHNWTAHNVGFLFSTALVVLFLVWGWKSKNPVLGSLTAMLVVTHDYIIDFGSANHPVVATAFFGIASLLFAKNQRWWLFSVFLTAALLIRESALVFAVGSLFFIRQKRQLFWLLPPFAFFVAAYLWYFQIIQKFEILNQAHIVRQSGGQPFDFDFDQFTDHFVLVFVLFQKGLLYLFFAVLTFYSGFHKKIFSRTTLAFFTVFATHSVFFGLYTEKGLRLGFIGGSAFLAMVFWLGASAKFPKPWRNTLLFVCTLFCLADLATFSTYQTPHYQRSKDEAEIYKKLSKEIRSLNLFTEKHAIVATNPYHSYMNNPVFGLSASDLQVEWHGGAPGFTKFKQNYKAAVVHVPLEGWAEEELFELIKSQNFVLYKEIRGNFKSVQIWVHREILESG